MERSPPWRWSVSTEKPSGSRLKSVTDETSVSNLDDLT
jgi:hypothetical protein